MKKFPAQFQTVVDYLKEELDIEVMLGKATQFQGHYIRRIVIHHNYNLDKNGLYALLHEAGHAHQPADNSGPNLYKNIDMDEQPKKFQMYQFVNEQDAWDKAIELVVKLGLTIDLREFNKLKEEALLTYFPTSKFINND